jgi:hypothetical protein
MRIGVNPQTAKAWAALCAVVGLVAAAVIVLSGCGASETLDPIARAAEVTSQQEGARISITTQLSSAALPEGGYKLTASGYIDERDRSGEMSMDLSGIPGASALPGGGTGTVQMIYQYPVVYMSMPFLAGKLPEGKTWIKLDLTKAASAAGINLSQLSSLNQTDPTQFLEYLRASSGGVTAVGSETVDGVPTTHYRADLQLSSILDRVPSSEQAAVKAALDEADDAGSIPVDVWVDAQGRVRRMQLAIAASVPTGTGSGVAAATTNVAGTITIDFTSYGHIPPIVPPPSSQVFDASTLAAAGVEQGVGE